jgi:3-mercaptopyruvate sulfurtransferase SseA
MLDGRLSKYFDRSHIPTSKSVPFSDVMDDKYCFKPHEEMIEVYKKVGVKDPSKDRVVLTC